MDHRLIIPLNLLSQDQNVRNFQLCVCTRCYLRTHKNPITKKLCTPHKGATRVSSYEFCNTFGKKYVGKIADNPHYFDNCCLRLLQITARRWNPPSAKLDYMAKFNSVAWKRLGKRDQRQHTLQSCQGCLHNHSSDQAKVPERYHLAKKRVPLLHPATEQLKLATEALPPTKKAKREVLKDFVNTANKIWENVEPDSSIPQAIASYVANTGIILRPSPAEMKQKQSEMLKNAQST